MTDDPRDPRDRRREPHGDGGGDRTPDDRSPSDHGDGPGTSGPADSRWLASLGRLFDALESLSGYRLADRDGDRRSGTDPVDRRTEDREAGWSGLDVDVAVRSGLDALDSVSGPPTRGRVPSHDRSRSGDAGPRHRSADTGQRRHRRRDRSVANYHATTRSHDDELLVIVDVAGVDADDVTAGFDGDELVVRVDGRDVERVDVPWTDRTTDATVRNSVLTVRVRRASSDESDERPDDYDRR